MTAIQLDARIARRTFSGHSLPRAHFANARPMSPIVANAQNAA